MSRAKSAIARLLGTTDPEVIKKVGEVAKKQATERDHIEASDATTYKARPIQVVPKEYYQAKKAEAEAKKRDEAEAKAKAERDAILNTSISDIVAMSPDEKDAHYEAYNKASAEESEYQWQKQQEAQAMRDNQLKAYEDYVRKMAELEDMFERNEQGSNFPFLIGKQSNLKGIPGYYNNPRYYRDMLNTIEQGKAEGKKKAKEKTEEYNRILTDPEYRKAKEEEFDARTQQYVDQLHLHGELMRNAKFDGSMMYIEQPDGILGKKRLYFDKDGKLHNNRMLAVQANEKIDIQQQHQDIMQFANDPMARDAEIAKVKQRIDELGKQRELAAQNYSSSNPFLYILSAHKGQKALDPWLEGAYGPEAQALTYELEKEFAKLDNLENIKKKYESGQLPRGGFWNGVNQFGQAIADKVTDRSWAMYDGMGSMLTASGKQQAFDKIAKGERLTPEEMQWASIEMAKQVADATVESPYVYDITTGVAESAPYIKDMMLSPGKGISNAFTQWGIKRFGMAGFNKLVGNILQASAMTATIGADDMVAGTIDRMAGNLQVGDNGLEVTDQESVGKALAKQFASQTTSNVVELMGVPIIGKASKAVKGVAKNLADALTYGKASKALSAMDKSSAVNFVNGMRKSMAIHELPEEIGEEYVEGLAQSVVEGEDQFSQMLTTEEALNIVGTCGLMTGIFGVAKVGGFAIEYHKVNREFKKAKQEVLRQFSSDVWASLDNLITNTIDEDLTTNLATAVDGLNMNKEQKKALLDYLFALKKYQKFNELNDGGKFNFKTNVQEQAQGKADYVIGDDLQLKDEVGNAVDAKIVGIDEQGRYIVESAKPVNGASVQAMSVNDLNANLMPIVDGVQEAEVEGMEMTDPTQQAEVSMLTDNARESVAALLGVTPDAVDVTLQQVLGDNPTDAKIDARFGGNAQVVKDYMYNVAKTKGMSARLIDDIADATAESDRAIDAVDNNGNVVTAKDANGNDVNVISGNIVTYEDGLIDTHNSDSSVVIRHADGTTEMAAPTSLTEVVSMPTEQAKAAQAQAIAQQKQQAFADAMSGALDYSQGQQYTMLNADGSTTDVTIVADNGDGNVTVTARDGNKQGGVTDGKQIVLPKSQIQQGVREFKRNELRVQKAKQTSVPQAESAPTEVAEPIQEPSMPTDEQGNVLYEQMDADSAWDALLAETGGDADMAMTVANEMIADKTKAVEEASKMVAEPGTTPQEKIANLKAVKQAQAQAQAELDAWKAIAETPNRRMSIAEEATTESVVESTPTESESTPQVGLVEDARTRTLGDKTRKMLDAMAKRLGLQVEFVDEVNNGKANADIVGNKVRIAWDKRDQALDFLLGHEFTHRMQDLSPEAYAEFVEATKQALGEEEWNKRINRMKSLYKQHGINISEQGIINEVVADYAGELVEERGVFDNFVERNKNNRSLLSKIADVLRSIKEFFTLGKQRKINNAIARLEALIESASEANLRGDVVNMEKERYSVSSIFEGIGAIVFNEEGGANIDKDGNFYVIINGKQYDGNNLITLDDIKADKRSVLNLMVEDAIKEGNVTEEHADVIMKKYVDIMNMFLVEGLAENGGYANMADKWMWVGSTVYKSVAKNGDKQYLKSIDITRVCKKNEAVIRAISEMQKRVGYGITPAQILDIYVESYESGYQVPCPVCYVFSRYLRNGKYASGAILGMEQYGEHLPGGKGETWTAEQWVAELRRLEEIDNNNKTLYDRAASDIVEAETMIDDLGIKFQQATSEAERKALRAEIEKTDARYRAALNIFSQSALTQWIKQFAIIGNPARLRDDAKYPDNIESFKEHALDVRKSAETMTLYPAIRRLRNSGGSTVGKEIAYESNNDLGEVIAGLASASADASNNAYQKTIQSKDDKEFEANRKKATEQFQKASQYIKQQTLRGGQRMWSWSDNIEALMPDIVINLMQLELLGGALQTYSKQLEGVNLVARSGGYVNGSLMAKDNGYAEVTEDMIKIENGQEVLAEDITEDIEEPTVKDGVIKRTRVLAQAGSPIFKADGKKYVLIFDDVIGIDPHGDEGKLGLFDLNKMLSKAGNIIVGMNDTHIRVGLADSRIFFIIPWHSSGANNHILAEMFRVLGADIESMVSQDYEDVQNEKDYGNKVPQSVTDIWESNKNEKDFECGIKGGIDSSQGKISESQKHYRELREAIFNGTIRENRVWLREVQNDEFLKQVLDRVETDTLTVKTKDGKLVHMMEKEDNNHIYPYEYWDTSKTYSEADINGERYIEYCRRLGFSPKFSGNHEGANPNEFGNFTNDKGYWKLLVDRRMYDINGEFQDLDPVTTKDYTNELVHPSDTHKKFKVSQVADAKATSKIVDRVIEKETERFGGEMPMVDYTLSHDEVYKNYKAEHDLLMADEAYRKAVGEVAEAQKNVDAVLVTGETKSIAKAKSRLVSKQLALTEARKNATKADKVATKARQRYSLSNLTEEEQRIVDEAKANGTYLKAPNGKASNLNERQWIQVRTKAFKDWFGDWENDPENASKVVDENGEPMVVDGLYLNLERNPIDDISRKINKATNLVKMIKDAEIQTGTRYGTMDFLYTNQGAEVSDRVFSSPYSDIIEDLYNGTEPEIVVGFRYGKIRDNGKSYNYRDNAFEKGVSIVGRVHELNMQKSSYYEAFFGDAPYNMILGVNLGHTGADGEILLTFAEVIGNAEKSGEIAKSATENVGTFDASNPDIRYSLATEQVESVLEDYTLNKDNALDFEFALMESIAGQSYSANPSYKMLDGVEIRVKDHTPDWDNFVDWETDKVKSEKILNVTVGDYENTDYRRNKEDYESFIEAHPETTAVNVDIEDGTSLADALSQIHEALNAKGIDFEFAPDYSWTKWSEYTTEQTDIEGDYGGERYSLVTDPATIEMLESAPKVSDSGVKLYRAMIEIDGKLYPPMSSMVEDENGEKVMRESIGIGDWVKSDEDLSKATLRNGKYYFDLLKDDGTSVDQVAYNPYLHTSDSMLNDQFKSAQSRPNLVVVEMEIPITGDYKAEGAKDAVGFVPGGWKSGDVATQLPTNRNVYLSQYGKPVRIVPTEEVAQHIYDRINGYVDVMPSNVVTPQVREALEKMGVQFVETDNQSVILEGEHKGKQWTHVYGKETIRKREEKSAKANAWVETTKQRLANAEAELQKAKDNVAMLEQTEAEGVIGKTVGSAIEKAKEKVAKAEAKVAKAKATHEKAKSKVEPRYASRYSLQGGRSIADKYEKRVNTKGKGGKMHLSKFNAMEAWQDEMRALKEVQRIIEKQYGIQLEDFENAYMAENALSSVNQAEWERYIKDYYEPMMEIIDKWILKGGETEQTINHYLIAKSGLERNREFTVRDALAEMDKMDRQIINGAYSGTVLQLANALRQGQISQDEYDAQVQEAKDKKNQALENIKNAQQARVDAYKAERDALREQLKNGDITYEEFNQLSDEVAIRHAKVEEIKDYSGLTALAKQYNEKDWRNFAEQMVVNFENKHDNTDVLWERINNATKKAVEKSYESGITSKEAKDHLDQMFLWYVPMGGMENDTAEDIYSYLNRNADSAFTQTVKRAEGHSEHISDDVMAMIANTMQSAILQGNRNKMKQKFLNMVQNYPTDLFTLDRGWVVMQGNEWVESHPEIKADYTAEQVRDAINAHNEEMRNLEEQGLAMSKEGALKLGVPFKNAHNEQEHAISVMRNGQKVTIYVNGNPRVAQALNGKLKDVEQTWIGKAYGKLKRYFSASKTSWSPDFISSNFSRDIGHSTSMTFVRHGVGEWGKSIAMYAPATATLVAKALGKKSPWGAKYDQYFDEFVRNGGITGYSHLYSVDDWKIQNTKRIDRLRGVAKAIKAHNNLWVNLGKVYKEVNSIIENSSRFNEYARSRNRGEGIAASIWNAKEITLNFNKKGSGKTEGLFGGIAFLGRNLVPFFNPIMQGIYQFLKVGKEHKGRMAALCFGYVGMGFLQPFVNAMLVELLGGGDEDDYMKQPEYTRRTNFMLYVGDGYIKIPLAQIFREFYGIGDVIYCAMYGKLSAEDATSQAISQVRKIFSLDGVSTYFDWAIDIATNTNFMGNPLWKENDFNEYKPEYTKAYDNTWAFLVSASKWMNEALGGDEYTAPDDFNGKWINPAIWQRLLSELGGGALTSVLDVYDTASALAHGEDVDWANVPIAKRLYTETDEETLQKWIDKEYFSNLDNYKKVKDRMSSLKSSPLDVAEKIDFMYHSPEYLEYVIFDDAQKEIKELRDKADSATDDNRTEREKALYDAELEVVEAIDAVRAMGDNEVQTFMMQHPEVAYYINKDIERKVKDNVKELQKAIARKEPNAREALSAYRKSPEYKYYNEIRRRLKRINKLESRLNDDTKNATPSRRLEWQKKIDDEKKELVELRKAYESIGEVKE